MALKQVAQRSGHPWKCWMGLWANLVEWEVSLPRAGGWSQMIYRIPSNLKHSMILLFCRGMKTYSAWPLSKLIMTFFFFISYL